MFIIKDSIKILIFLILFLIPFLSYGQTVVRDSLSIPHGAADGRTAEQQTNVNWTDLVGAGGNAALTNGASEGAIMLAGSEDNKWDRIYRILFNFNGKDIPSDETLDSAHIYLDGASKTDDLNATPAVSIYPAFPAGDAAIQGADYNNVSDTPATDTISYAGWSTTGYNKFTLNIHGLNHIDSCITASDTTVCFALRTPAYDVADNAPNWVDGQFSRCVAYMSESAGNEPYLITYYSTPSADDELTGRILEVSAGQRPKIIDTGDREKIIRQP